MKKSCHKVTAVIPALLLVACVDNRNDFTGVSPNSEETTASLPAPENLSATASDNEVSLSWDTVDGASAYNVYIYNQSGYIQSNYSPANPSAADTSASAIVSTNSHLLSSLEYEVDYYFNVTALADDLESNQSNEVGVRPLQNFSNSTPSVQLLNTNVNAAEVVTLSAEVSDPDGNNISYLWQQTSGASVDIVDGNESEATFTAPTVDTPVELGFALTVFDNLGASSTSSATVTVSDNLAPQVDAGADQSVSSGATVNLLGSASDSDGSIVDIAWQQESGSIVSLSSTSTLATSFTAPSASSELTLIFQLSATDDRGDSATDTVSVIVTADQATTTIYRVDVAENSNGTIHVATTMDPEQEILTYSTSGTDADNFSIDSSSGAISFVSTPDYETPTDANTDNAYELTFAVSNGTTTTLQELVITVTDVDEAPTITSAPSTSTSENTTTTFTASATDPESNPLSYSLSGTDAANFAINPSSGAISFTTVPDYENPVDTDANNVYALTLEVSDSTHSTSQALTITVTNIDEPPSITSAASTITPENTTTTIYTASASDPENDTLSYSLSATDAAHLSINPSSGAISFAINPDHENPADADANNIYELTLEVSDSTHTTSQALAITVDDTNDNAPIITAAQSFSIDENSANGSAIGTVVATDIDASPTTYQDWMITSGNINAAFAIDSSSGELSVATGSELDHESTASYTLALSVSDGVNTASAETLSINVDDVNDNAPIITAAQSFSIDENSANGSTIGTVVATDADASPTTYQDWTIISGNTNAAFAIDSSSGELSVATSSELDYESTASYTLALSVSDGVNSASAETLSINLSNVNEQPSFTSAATASANENDSSFAYTASATDVDAADSLTYSISGGADAAAFTLNGASLSFIATPNYESPADSNQDNTYEVELQVTDAGGLSDYLDLQISVTNVNEAPSFTSVDATVDVPENTSGTIYTLEASDVDSDDTDDTLTYSIAGGADKLSFSLDGAELSFINPPNYEAPQAAGSDANIYTVELAVSDDEGKAAAANLILSFQVTDANEAPVFTSVSGTYDVAENTSDTIFTLAASDVDSGDTDDTLTYSIAGGADRLLFSLDGNELSFAIPPPDYENPQAAGDDANIYTVELAVSDDDGKASETNLILSFNVTDVNEAPTITSTTNTSVPENTTTTIYTASATDPENDTLTYDLSGTDQDDFIIDSSSGAISFVNTPDHESPTDADTDNVYQVTLEVSDSNANTATQVLAIEVTNVNETPTITSATSANILENNTTTIYTASATDPENDTLTYDLSGTDQDDFIINPSSGAISFAATPNYEAPTDADTDNDYQVTLEASDGSNTVTQELTFTITDVNEHSVSAPTDADDATNQIAEDATAGTAVGITASASDADGTYNTVSYGFTNGNQTSDDNLFSIDPNSGIVKLLYSNSLDYETATSHDIVIKASSSDGSSATHAFTIDVTDVDEFDVSFATEPDANSSLNQISEDAAAGTAVGITASASDADGTNNTISYSFDNDSQTSADNLFSIASDTGIVTLANSASLDYETTTSYNIVIKATSSDGSSTTHTFTVAVTDVNEFDVSFATEPDADGSLNQIAEDATAGTAVGITASASDGDGTNNTISYSFDNDLLTSGFFSIDASSGVVTLTNSNSLDYETATSHDIVIKASSTDGSTATSSTLTISVIDHDEFDVSTPTDSDSDANQITENANSGDTVGITASASDDDATNNTISYSFDNDSQTSDDNLFSIASDTGIVTLINSNSLDYETATSHNIVIKATSTDGSTAISSILTINVIDHDEFGVSTPTDSDSDTNQIAENASSGDTVGITASASDDDGTNNTVSYSFDNDSQTSGFFSIDASSGVVTLTNSNSLDYETVTSHDIVIKATSTDGSTATSNTLTISVIDHDEFDVSTPTDSDSDANQIAENASSGDTVGITASASDDDGTSNTVSYSFDNDSQTSSFFSIDASSGVVTLTNSNSLDYETVTSHDIVIKATSTDGSTATSSTLTISVIDHDEFDVSTPTDSDSDANQIAENASSGDTVGITASASDDDGTNNTVSYSFDNDLLTSGFFSIDASSGVVTLANSNSLDYETATSHDIVIKATSTDGSTATSSTLTINVIDHDEFDVSTPTDGDSATNQIAENASSGTTVGITASASDGDDSDTVSYSFANDLLTSGFFSIDASSGVVNLTNTNSLDYETATSHNIVVKAISTDGSTATSSTLTINVIDHDEFDVTTPTDGDSDTNQIAENASSGTTVGITASASDGDDSDTVSYSFANDLLTSGFFSIDASSGVVNLTNSNSLDYETATSHDIVIKATSTDGSTATSSTLTINVIDHDEFDVTTPTDGDSDTNQIAENASSGTTVGITVSASDGDDSDTVSYSFANDLLTSGFFSIDASSGVVNLTNTNSLDYETATSHDIVIKATSTDGSTATSTLTINVIDHDEFDVTTPTDGDSDTNQIAENASSGTTVGITAAASDGDDSDTVSYSFDNDSQTSGFFSIDASSGVVTLTNTNSLDYETATSHDIVVKAISTDGSTATSSTLTISVVDHDEFDITTPTDSDSATNQIAENASSGTTVGITVSASDGDDSDTVSYSFANDLLTSGFFSIDVSSGVVTLTNTNSLDYETATSHDIVVKATSTDGSTATSSTLTINVIDHDEFDVSTPTDGDSATNQIAENASSGTTVGITASASDPDGTNNTISYSLTNDSQTSADNLFSIASDTGIVTLANSNSLDYETATSHDIVVKATSSDGSTDSETFTVSVTDVNDNTPIITPSQSFDIDEASANGTSVGTVKVTDADSDAVNTFTWSITGGNTNDAFAIDDSTGEITVAISSELDYEGGTILYTLSLTVSDGATTSSAETVTINILDVSEHDAAPSAAYLGLPDNYINITFTPESGVSYQLHRSFVEGCTSSSCDAEGYQLFASPNSSGTADTMTFSQTHYYSLVGDNSTTFTTSINDSDGAKLAALVAAQSLSTEYDLANDWVNISSTDSNNVIYTLYMAGEPFAAGGCEDSELDNIGSLCADGSSLSDGSMHSATEVINWSARRYYRLDISDGYQVVHSLESNASVIDPVVLNASNASLTIDITWSALNSSKLAEYTVYLSDDSAATTASAATWSSLSNPQIISGNSSELYSLVPILSQYYVAITATNTENETTPLSKVYLVNNIVTGDPDPSTWHEIIADTDDSPAHWEGRSTHGSLVFQDKMWLIGGRTANEAHIAEVWSSTDGYNWTEVNPSAAFGARREFVSMVHDGKMWVLGGEIEGYVLANDVWYSSDGANWHEATEAASWHARDYFGGVSFASGATGSDEMWVLGHYTGDPRGIPGVEDHHYSTDGSTWSSVSVSGLPPSSFFPAITFNNAILIVGGYFYTNSAWSNSNTIYSSTDGVNWTELSVSGSIWDARRIHTTLVYDDKLWVLAGDSGYNRDDYWYSSDGTQWHEATASGSKWEARSVHTSVNYAGRMWMLGGYGSTGDKQLNDVWASGLEITSFSFQEVLSNSL